MGQSNVTPQPASVLTPSRRRSLLQGLQAGIPIGLGYFAVSFSLGIAAKHAGLSPFQAFLASALGNASAGEYAVFTLIAANASYLELALMTLIANARYLLMSCAMSQRMAPGFPLRHRLLMGYFITDEFFAITISKPGFLDPYFMYGAICFASPCWSIGTALGVAAGNLLPLRVVSALSVALYGMFLAVIVPKAREDKIVAGLALCCFALSWASTALPLLSALSDGSRVILLTAALSAAAALRFPVNKEEETP